MTEPRGPDDDELEVRVTGGTVRGVREGGVLAWRGMPYAEPPVGKLRFAAPAPVRLWHGVRDASEFGPIAPQTLLKRLVRPSSLAADVSEDCLNVNVYAPASPSEPNILLIATSGLASRSGAISSSRSRPRARSSMRRRYDLGLPRASTPRAATTEGMTRAGVGIRRCPVAWAEYVL